MARCRDGCSVSEVRGMQAAAPRCPLDQYSAQRTPDTAYAFNEAPVLSVNYTPCTFCIPLSGLKLAGCPDNARPALPHTTNLQTVGIFRYFYPLAVISASPACAFICRRVILHATQSAAYIGRCNAFPLLSFGHVVSRHVHVRPARSCISEKAGGLLAAAGELLGRPTVWVNWP